MLETHWKHEREPNDEVPRLLSGEKSNGLQITIDKIRVNYSFITQAQSDCWNRSRQVVLKGERNRS